jgi:cytochrome P450
MSTDFRPLHLLTSTPPLIIAAYLLLALTTWILLWGAYNLYLHPLRSYPGPKLWAAYRVPYILSNVRGRLPYDVHSLHQKYGPVVRVAPDHLVFTSPEAWNDIYGLQSNRIQNRKDPHAYSPQMKGWEMNIIYAEDSVHQKLRRIYGPAFTPKALEEQQGMLLKYADMLVEQLKGKVGEEGNGGESVQDLSAWYNFTTFDLTGDFAFGEAFHW